MADPRLTHQPHDRLTRLCDAMTQTLDAHPEMGDDVKCVVFLQDGDKGGLQLHGYEDNTEAIVDVFFHLQAIFRAQGKELELIAIPDDPSGMN